MGRLSGFRRHVAADVQAAPHDRVPAGQARQARAPARPPRPQPLRGRHGEVHRLRAVRGRVPGALHLRARRRQPDRRPGVAGRALRLRLRDQLPALHPLRPVRRGVPDRGDHRDEALRVLVHQPRRRDLHQGRAARRRRRPGQAACRGSCGSAARTTTRARGCARRRRRASAAYEGRVNWSGELGFGVRPPEHGSDAPTTPRSRRTTEWKPSSSSSARPRSSSARSASIARAQPGALGAVPAAHAGQRRGVLPAADAALVAIDPDRRVRERDRRAVPVRDHAARRRPARDARRAAAGSSGRSRSCSACSCSSQVVVLAGNHWVTGAHSTRGAARRPAAAATCETLATSLFTDFVWAFEITAVLLVIAVVGGVVLARRSGQRPATAADRRRRRRERVVIAAATITPTYYLTLAAALFTIGARRPARPPQHARDVHVHRADAQRREPHVRRRSPRRSNDISGQVIVFFTLVVAAAEVAVGLAIIVAIFRRRQNVTADDVDLLEGLTRT